MHLKHGSVLQGGKYKIEKLLGQGGFGITYLAVQTGLNRKVAIKEFFMKEHCNRDADTSYVSVPSVGSRGLVAKFKEKFIKEAGTIAALDNPHVVRIHDVFEENGTAYYVMEYLGDDNLAKRISPSGMPHEEAAAYVRQIGEALSYIHSQNILHLDVKPSNVMFRHGTEVVIIDFGISKHYDGADGGQTSTSAGCVSEGYSPMEQYEADGVSSFTAATDIYSLGATLYHLLCGRRPAKASVILNEGLDFPESMPQAYRDFIKKAMFRARTRMVCIPSPSSSASPAAPPWTLFQYWLEATGIPLMVKYLFSSSKVAEQPPRRATVTLAPTFIALGNAVL